MKFSDNIEGTYLEEVYVIRTEKKWKQGRNITLTFGRFSVMIS